MRLLFIYLLILLIANPSFAQVPPTPEKPNQMAQAIKDMNQQITDLEKQIAEAKKNKEDAETIKQLETRLEIFKKQLENIEELSKDISNVPENTRQPVSRHTSSNAVPERDVNRINMLPKKVMSDAELVPYIKGINAEVEKVITSSDKTNAMELYNATLKSKYHSPKALGNIASACWMSGHPEMALYIMGKVCLSDMSDGNNLNTYASFLTMAGGDHAALPILQNLNTKFPNNSTILNNIGQAWYGLGEMNNANTYLDSSVHFYSLHSQANQTKSVIEKSEGKTQESIESLKRSIKENYSPEKEAKLNELGGKLEYQDITFPYPARLSPLGIEKFILKVPAYPFEGGITAEISRMEWSDFRENISAAKEKILKEEKQIKARVDAYNKRLMANPMLLMPYNNPVYKTASRKRTLLLEWANERKLVILKKIADTQDSVNKWKEEYNEISHNTEGCGARKGLASAFLSKANLRWQQTNAELMTFQKEVLNAEARLALYANTDQSLYELEIASIKEGLLGTLGNLSCEFEVGCILSEPDKPAGKGLPDFDSVNCQYKDQIVILFTTMKFECNKMSTEFYISPQFNYKEGFSPYLKFGWEENLNTGKITKGTIEFGGEAGISDMEIGPLKPEAKVEGGVGVEIGEHGIEQIYIKGSTRVDVGQNIENGDVTNYTTVVGAETEITWNAGNDKVQSNTSAKGEGKGILSGIHIGGH